MKNGFSTYQIACKAGVPQPFKAVGTQFRVLEGEGLEITAYAKTESLGTLRQMQVGRGIAGLVEEFTSLSVLSDSDQTVLIAVSFGNVFDDTKANAAETAGNLVELGAVTCVQAVSTQIAAGNANRKELLVLNTGTVPIYLRSDNTAAVSAVLINPGDFITLEAANTIYAYNPAPATNGEVTVSEVSS